MSVHTQRAASTFPHPRRRLPGLGDILAVSTASPTQSEFELSKELGPIYELKFGTQRFLVVTSGELAKQVNNEQAWSKLVAGPFLSMRKNLTGAGLLTAANSDPLWGHANQVLRPGFVPQAMRRYHGAMSECVNGLSELWANQTKSIDVSRDMSRLTLEVIGQAGFGTEIGALRPDYDYGFTDSLTRALTNVSRSANDLPFSQWIFRSRLAQFRHDTTELRAFAQQVIERRHATGERRNDLLDMMLHGSDALNALPDENIADQVLTFLAAGNDTTAGLLSFCFYYMSQQPEYFAAVRAEVEDLCGQEPVGFEDVARLKLTRRLIDETLRLWPVAPGYFRKATADQELAGRSIPRGTVVFVLTLGVHRDEGTWGHDADAFDPARWENSKPASNPNRVYKPFGTGPRACIGRMFALHEATLAVAELSRRFTLNTAGSSELHVHEMLTLKPEGFSVRVQPVA
ncbi:cytochrome P450 [Williamsia soli]|uniref:cytochrome P450 n=1 Tax=Williamsia soli TaxID=364929 RepID=UPI001A9F63C0|nr:cytochrome P450 [Williamsia soli]